MKTYNSIRNSIFSIIQYVIIILVGFISQKVFIHILGLEYLGINSLFTNIVSFLSIVELGIGSAIIYNLYKPLKMKNYETINGIMSFYRKIYHYVSIIILVLGMLITPFIPILFNNSSLNLNFIVIYYLFLFETVCSYLFSYKRCILYADQKNYILNISRIIYYSLLNFIQICYLKITSDYYGFLIFRIIIKLLENLLVNKYVDKNYKYLKLTKNKLDNEIYEDIKKKVRALFLHKIASYVVNGTDNIIISKYIGLITVGLYNNYYLVIDAVNKLFGQAVTALTPSIGHLLIENDVKKNYDVFKKVRFINFWIAAFSGVGILLIINPFISVWLGDDYLLDFSTLIVLVINFYQKMMRYSYLSFKEAAGIYYEDRFIPILESITNIVVSILLAKIIGLPGVFIGTIISGLWIWCVTNPKYVYKKLFDRNYKNYIIETLNYILLFLSVAGISYTVSKMINIDNEILTIIINLVITMIIPNLVIILIFRKSDSYIYFKELLKSLKGGNIDEKKF